MPLVNFFKKDKPAKDYSSPPLTDKERKSLFGLKVIQAQQNPEPVYDLSGCGAPWLPDDTFTFCKLLGKTTLTVKSNALTSLESGGSLQDLSELRILDASNNKIDKIPSSIVHLKNLRILNLSVNSLKSLPDAVQCLKNLEELYISHNKFNKLPLSICALPKLRVLDLQSNNIASIPKELSSLQHSLCVFKCDEQKIKDIPASALAGTEELMRYLCTLSDIQYEGIQDISDKEPVTNSADVEADQSVSEVDQIMIAFMRRKEEQSKAHAAEEEKLRELEKQQLENVLQNTSANKEELLLELSSSPAELSDFEDKKQQKLLGHIQLEEQFRNEQNEHLDIYLSNTTNKESLLQNITAQENDLQQEVESIVTAKEYERAKLLQDLSRLEDHTNSALEELLNTQQIQKSSDFAKLVADQEDEIQKIISGVVESSVELRQTDVLKAMQSAFMKDAWTEAQRNKIEEKQQSWVDALVKEGEVELSHLENLMNNKAADQECFVADLLLQEKYQEEAFRLLLSNVDLKRNSVMRQIALVEYELIRLSSLELRKRVCGVRAGSAQMHKQRQALVDLLCSLFEAKDDRDKELENWVHELAMRKGQGKSSEDFWILQYQQLMNMKPAALAKAEENLDPTVYRILVMSSALDLLPIFANYDVSFTVLLDMAEEDFAKIGIGSASYHSIQRSLHNYLSNSKLGSVEPSAPEDHEPQSPSSCINEDEASAPMYDDQASAPQLDERFIESECVICMNSECRVLFMPCGHVCVCALCCQKITMCPLCRSEIASKCFVSAT